MIIAFALDNDLRIAPTLGTAEKFRILSGKEERTVPAEGTIPGILRKQNVNILFCGGIGMCLFSLLEAEGIRIVPGCKGEPDTILQAWRKGTLPPAGNFLCSDHGRTCGSCPGRF